MVSYPRWAYYPTRDRPPEWVTDVVAAVAAAQHDVDSSKVNGLTSDKVLALLRPGLETIGFRVEAGKTSADRITLPVLFGEQGLPRVRYDVDGVHDELGVLLEVEAGRGARGNAVYRDLVRTSLIVDARYLALGVMQQYRHKSAGKDIAVHSYDDAKGPNRRDIRQPAAPPAVRGHPAVRLLASRPGHPWADGNARSYCGGWCISSAAGKREARHSGGAPYATTPAVPQGSSGSS